MRNKSKFDIIDINKLIEIIKNSDSYREVILKVGLNGGHGAHYIKLKSIISKFSIDTSHMTRKKNSSTFNINTVKKPIEKYLVKSSRRIDKHLKKRIIDEGVLKNECAICGQQPFHNNMKLTLQLDHKDGDPTNNEKDNLRLLCPNCHSQTPNWGSKNTLLKVTKKIKVKKERKSKFHVSKEYLEKLIKEKSMREIGKMFGVSDNAIKKRCKKLNIQLESYYWQNKLLHKHAAIV